MSANLPILWSDKKNSPELKAFLAQFGAEYCFSAEEMNQLRDAVNEMAVIQQSTFKGTAEPTGTPSGTGNRYWVAVTPGTYTNFGGVVVTANSLAIISVTAAGVFSVSQIALDLSSYLSYEKLANNYSTLNLFPNSNFGLILTKINASNSLDNLPAATYQTGTPTTTIVQNFEGFNSVLKINLKVGDRLNFVSSKLKIDALTANGTIKLNVGVYVKVPSSYTGTITLYLVKTSANSNANGDTDIEYVQLGNNWRYYRLKAGVLVAPSDNIFHLGVYLNNIGGTTVEDLYLAAPSILRTENTITPGIYNGIDTLKDYSQFVSQDNINALYLNNYDIEGNILLDHRISKQKVFSTSSSPWYTSGGNPAASFTAPFEVASVQTPIGNTALQISHSKISDGKISDCQILQKFIVPAEQQSNSLWSFGFWMKRETLNASPIAITNYYYSNENYTGTLTGTSSLATITGEIVGSWVFVKYNNVVLPPGTKSIALLVRTQYSGTLVDTITKLWITGITVNLRSGIINGSLQNQTEITKEIITPLLPTEAPLKYSDFYELNNNQFKDAVFSDQITGASSFTGVNWAMDSGGSSRFLSTYGIVSMDSPVGNKVLAIDVKKRSSDGYISDNQPRQNIVIPTNLRGRTATWSFGFWMKRESSIPLIQGVANYFTEETFSGGTLGTSTYTATITGETVGSWVFVKFNNITLPPTAKSLSIKARISWDSSVLIPIDTIYKVYLTGFNVDFNSTYISGYTKNFEEKMLFISGDSSGTLSRLKGKKWCSFGDSITAANGYQTAVTNRYGLIHYLRGIGGSGVSEGTQIAWVDASGLYITRPPDTQPTGSFQIYSQAYQQDRINTIPTDTDIISIMFGTNDISLTLGTINDTSSMNTFYGKYQQMLDLIYIRIPNAEVILTTPIFRVDEPATDFYLKREAIFKIGKKYAYRVIDVGGLCGINKNNSTVYLSDGIHPNSVGNARVSIPLINEFKEIYG